MRTVHSKLLLLFLVSSVASQFWASRADALAIDLLGDTAKPLIGPMKAKVEGLLKYIWLQPYGGYGFGSGALASINAAGATTTTQEQKYEGFFYGGRGGLLLFRSIRLGADFTQQFASRKEGTNPTSLVSRNLMFGASLGFDLPRTPLQLFGARYFSANMNADGDSKGDGWGAGVSFMLFNPFILHGEYRWLKFTSDIAADGSHNDRDMKQFYFALSFMLL